MINPAEYANKLFDIQIRKIPDEDQLQKENTIKLKKVVEDFVRRVSEYNEDGQRVEWYKPEECQEKLFKLDRGYSIMTASDMPFNYLVEKDTFTIRQGIPTGEDERQQKGYYKDETIPYTKFWFLDVRGPPDRDRHGNRIDAVRKLHISCYHDSVEVEFDSHVWDMPLSDTKKTQPELPSGNYAEIIKRLAEDHTPKLIEIVDAFGPFSEKRKEDLESTSGDLIDYPKMYGDMFTMVSIAKRTVILEAIDRAVKSLSVEYKIKPSFS